VIANYNHSHALSINYYEVVQVFRVEVRLAKAEQVLYVPMSLPNFNDPNIVRRFQIPMARAALSPQIMRSFITIDQIQLDPAQQTSFSIFRRPLVDLLKDALTTRSSLTAGTPILSTIQPHLSNAASATSNNTTAAVTGSTPAEGTPSTGTPSINPKPFNRQ
jgi:hypothetical protein